MNQFPDKNSVLALSSNSQHSVCVTPSQPILCPRINCYIHVIHMKSKCYYKLMGIKLQWHRYWNSVWNSKAKNYHKNCCTSILHSRKNQLSSPSSLSCISISNKSFAIAMNLSNSESTSSTAWWTPLSLPSGWLLFAGKEINGDANKPRQGRRTTSPHCHNLIDQRPRY